MKKTTSEVTQLERRVEMLRMLAAMHEYISGAAICAILDGGWDHLTPQPAPPAEPQPATRPNPFYGGLVRAKNLK